MTDLKIGYITHMTYGTCASSLVTIHTTLRCHVLM